MEISVDEAGVVFKDGKELFIVTDSGAREKFKQFRGTYTSSRRTGRTTNILKAMMKSKFDYVYFISLTPNEHRKMFIDLVVGDHILFCTCCGQSVKNKYEESFSRSEIIYRGKVFRFVSDKYDLVTNTKGMSAIDIYRDHLIVGEN